MSVKKQVRFCVPHTMTWVTCWFCAYKISLNDFESHLRVDHRVTDMSATKTLLKFATFEKKTFDRNDEVKEKMNKSPPSNDEVTIVKPCIKKRKIVDDNEDGKSGGLPKDTPRPKSQSVEKSHKESESASTEEWNSTSAGDNLDTLIDMFSEEQVEQGKERSQKAAKKSESILIRNETEEEDLLLEHGCLKLECRNCKQGPFNSMSLFYSHVQKRHDFATNQAYKPVKRVMDLVLSKVKYNRWNKSHIVNGVEISDESDDDLEEDLVVQFEAGDLVFAKMPGFPWWPGIVTPDPNSYDGSFRKLNNFHVVFMDDPITRAWVKLLKPYSPDQHPDKSNQKQMKKYKNRLILSEALMKKLSGAMDLHVRANEALKMLSRSLDNYKSCEEIIKKEEQD